MGDDFDKTLNSDYRSVSSPKTGDIVRYGDKAFIGGKAPLHAALFLIKKKKGTQVFAKMGQYSDSPYEITWESRMLQDNPYGVKRGMDVTTQSYNSETQKQETKTVTQSPYYRKK